LAAGLTAGASTTVAARFSPNTNEESQVCCAFSGE